MKAQKGLKLLFDAVLAEAKENPGFARRIEKIFAEWTPAAKKGRKAPARPAARDALAMAKAPADELHPTRDLERLGEDGLLAALEKKSAMELVAMIDAHNLDPAGKMADETKAPALAAFVVAAAKKKLARDRKAFDY